MSDTTINHLLLSSFTNAQRFLVTLLCEYYEHKCKNENEEIVRLCDQNDSLQAQIKTLKSESLSLQKENKNLTTKLRSANNMVRLLSKTRENEGECKTPTRLNIFDIDNLIKDKMNQLNKDKEIFCNSKKETKSVTFNLRKINNRANENTKKINNEPNKNIKSIINGPKEKLSKMNNGPKEDVKKIKKVSNVETKTLKNTLKNIENEKEFPRWMPAICQPKSTQNVPYVLPSKKPILKKTTAVPRGKNKEHQCTVVEPKKVVKTKSSKVNTVQKEAASIKIQQGENKENHLDLTNITLRSRKIQPERKAKNNDSNLTKTKLGPRIKDLQNETYTIKKPN